MKNIIKSVSLLAALFFAYSCNPGGESEIQAATMGRYTTGYIQSDYGFKLFFKSGGGITIDPMLVSEGQRLYVYYSFTGSSNTGTEREGTLTGYIPFSTIQTLEVGPYRPEMLGNDGVYFFDESSCWASGGYINCALGYYRAKVNPSIHQFNLMFNEEESNGGSLVFDLHHDADGKTVGHQGYDSNNCELVGAYCSFDYVSFAKGKPVTDIKIKYDHLKEVDPAQIVTDYFLIKNITEPENTIY